MDPLPLMMSVCRVTGLAPYERDAKGFFTASRAWRSYSDVLLPTFAARKGQAGCGLALVHMPPSPLLAVIALGVLSPALRRRVAMPSGAMSQGGAARFAALVAAVTVAASAASTSTTATGTALRATSNSISETANLTLGAARSKSAATDLTIPLSDLANATDSILVSIRAALSCLAADECNAMCEEFGLTRGHCSTHHCICVNNETIVVVESTSLVALNPRKKEVVQKKSKLWFIVQVTVGAMAISTTIVFLYWVYGNIPDVPLPTTTTTTKATI